MTSESSPDDRRRAPMEEPAREFLRDFNGGGLPLYTGLNHCDGKVRSEVAIMCDTLRGARRSAVERPRWGVLYGTVLPQLAALGAAEVVQSPHAARAALRCVLALGVFATMSIWTRANRWAFDLQNWCDCAGEQMTIRVIESRPPQAEPLSLEHVIAAASVEEGYETAVR